MNNATGWRLGPRLRMILLVRSPWPDHAITAEDAPRHLAVRLGLLDGPDAAGLDGDHVALGLAAADLQPHDPGVPRAVALVEFPAQQERLHRFAPV
jgi:hypothetical protein